MRLWLDQLWHSKQFVMSSSESASESFNLEPENPYWRSALKLEFMLCR